MEADKSQNVGERIKMLRLAKCLKQLDFSRRIFVRQSYLSRVEHGAERPSDKLIKLIAYEFGANEQWLRDGIGNMFSDHVPYNGRCLSSAPNGCQEDRAGQIEIIIAALEKAVPRKPQMSDSGYYYVCPSCSGFIDKHEYKHGNLLIPHCKWCGQKIDWNTEAE